MKDVFRTRRMWRPEQELKPRYDVVIIARSEWASVR